MQLSNDQILLLSELLIKVLKEDFPRWIIEKQITNDRSSSKTESRWKANSKKLIFIWIGIT